MIGVIEHLTASLRDRTAAIDARASTLGDEWVTRMVRFGAVPILIAALLNIVEFHLASHSIESWALRCAWFNCLLALTTLSLTFTKWFIERWRSAAFLILTALVASNTVLGTLGGQPKLLFISLILLMVGTGSILPWPRRVQLTYLALCVGAYVTQTFWVPSLDGLGPYKLMSLLTAAAMSYFTCYVRDRFVRECEGSARLIRESEATLRQIFDANTDGITLIDSATRRIEDVNARFLSISGFRREEVIGKTTDELDVWTDPAIEQEFIRSLKRTGSITNMEVSFRGSDGRIIPSLLSSVTVVIHGKPCVMTLARDISDLRRSQEKLRESEATQRRIFNASLDWMSIIDMTTGDYLDVNESFVNAIGYRREEIIGSNFVKLGVWPNEEEWIGLSRTLRTSGEVRNQPVTFRTKDGTLVPCLVSAVQCELWGKKCCISTARDITELNETQEKLSRSEKTFRKIFDASLDSMSITDIANSQYIDVNPEFVRATGFSREEIIGKSADELGFWAIPEQRLGFVKALLENGEVRNMQTDTRMKDGIATSLTSGVLAEIGGKLCCLGVTRDISEIKAAEQKLRKSEATLRAIFDNSLDGISLVDLATQTLTEVNAELTRFIGFSREEMIGKSLEDLLPPADPVRQAQLVAMLEQGREVRNFEITLARRNRPNSPALLSAAIVLIDGRPHTLAVSRDITDLVAAREAAAAASKAKSEFLSIMSHEIRTPMNAILGMADLMSESELNPEQRRYLDTVLRNGNALLELINGILDLAKVESGQLNLETVEFDLIELTERAADALAVGAHEKGIELAVRFAADLPAMVVGDPHRLRQILTNLIGNAIKFTKRGEVVVKVGRNPDPEAPEALRFEVHDTGIGVPSDKIDNIFSIFTQADTPTTRRFGGSGLGLSIVQGLVTLMGGRVWVESEVGTGSTFFFTTALHLPDAARAEDRAALEPELRGVPILLVIEHATTRDVVAEVLRRQGAEIVATAAGPEALAALAAARPAHFGLLLVDGEMKSSDGYEVLDRLRKIAPEAAVVVLTNTTGLPSKVRRMRKQGVHHCVTKPIKRQELYGAIAAALSLSATPPVVAKVALEAPAATPRGIADRPLQILLADDSPDNRLLIRAYLKRSPYLLTEVENGQLAVDSFVTSEYDVILMDVQMPVLDGYSAVRAIRKWELEHGRPRTPIIALTASALEGDVQHAQEIGCDKHVSKPVKKATLLAAIADLIEAVSIATALDKEPLERKRPGAGVAASAGAMDSAVSNLDLKI
jgi:PAS domain S-box-containing protein